MKHQRTPRRAGCTAWLVCALLLAMSMANASEQPSPEALEATIAKLDARMFDAFNHCDAPGRLEEHADYFDPGVEFYHDTGGVTWTRDAMIANTRKNACGHYRRELVPGSLRVYPVKGFGAIEVGSHRFCQVGGDKCEGIADFTIVWRQQGDRWYATRVLSYGHRALAADGQ